MNKSNINLTEGKIVSILWRLAIPAILSQIINLLYNVVDRIYNGKLPEGDMAMAGLGIAMPIILLISAFSLLIGNGGAPLAAIQMGKQKNNEAEKILGNSVSLLIMISIFLTILFMLFKEPILLLFGASNATITYAIDYISIYLLGTLFVQFTLGLNPFIITQGFAKIGMFSVLIGAIINIILDPIFIFGLEMGVKGAALASVIAQFCSMLWVIRFLCGKKTKLKIMKQYLKLDTTVVGKILSLGMAPFIMHGSESLILIALNSQLLKYGGNIALNSMTIMSSLTQVVVLPLLGLAQGAQPILGHNLGAGKIGRVKKTFEILFITCLSYTIIIILTFMIFSKWIVMIFNTNPELVKTTTEAMKIYFAGLFVFGAQVACQQTFLALGKAKQSMMLVILRKLILLVPMILILPLFLSDQYKAILIAEPITDIVSTLITMICFGYYYMTKLKLNNHAEVMQPQLE